MPASAQPPTRVVLIRHGEPDESVRGRCYGRLDPGLSARGYEQIREGARLLRETPVSIVYASPRRRALESARLLAAPSLRIIVDDRLREIDFGDCEGLTYDEIATRYPTLYRQWMQHPTEVMFPAAESFHAMQTRVLAALGDIRRKHAGESVAVVSHGGVNRIVLADALGVDATRIFRFDQAYGCFNVIDFFGDEPLTRAVNIQPALESIC